MLWCRWRKRAVNGDRAYEHKERRARLRAAGIKDRIMHRRHKHMAALPYWQQRCNRLMAAVTAYNLRRASLLAGP